MNYPYAPRLDSRAVLAAGTYNAITGKTTWTLPLVDPTIDCVVLSDSFAIPGLVLAVTQIGRGSSGTVLAPGRHDDGPVIAGRRYTMSVELSRPYRRDRQGTAIIGDRLQVVTLYASHVNTGDYTVRVSLPRRADRQRVFGAVAGTLEETGELRYCVSGKTEEMQVFIENSTPRPTAVTAVDYLVDVSQGVG